MADIAVQLSGGKAAKLRASCDACNESKVRCSQTKPSCTRCQKQQIVCVYGLSRRTHKSAPRVGARCSSLTVDASLLPEHTAMPTVTEEPTQISSPRDSLISISASPRQDTEVTATASGAQAQSCPDQNVMDFPDDFTSPNFNLSSLIYQHGHHGLENCLLSPDAFLGQLDNPLPDDLLHDSEAPVEPLELTSEHNGCHCVSRATTELMSTLVLSHRSGNGADVQLSVIKRAIQTSRDCIYCTCATGDLALLTNLLLIARIIQGFEMTARARSPSGPTSSDSRIDSVASGSPKLTWGKLPIEKQEESQIKQYLLLLNFQQLEQLLRPLSDSIKQLRLVQDQGKSNPAHLMACECIHMWLEQWAQLVKSRLTG
ncbi:hypothetical protein PMIN01_13307 [Paraphaeosphaeria minitans]|uniref:Zn(2)-C6 fungal-type domain-containing protein n=1 Tax=Paraphaeosphaeria minitans TaxID=565426 RepID=A0A9P6G4H5_9PLEO|nr:hypothetical protein PMIN01_13307 [Paraphaeosphaeria minitans]